MPAGGGRLEGLTELSRSVAEIANQIPNDYQPYVGPLRVRPQGGRPRRRRRQGRALATSTSNRASVGNVGRLVVSELGGRANTSIRARQLGLELEGVVDARELSQLIKQLEADGLAFEGAEASFELLIRRHAADYAPPFRIVDYTCLVEQRDGRELLAEATVKVAVDGETLHTAADGNGPVNALDAALRKALRAFYPAIDDVHLVDYKVRILDGDAATAARTRVIIDSRRTAPGRGPRWARDTNIIAASASALADSLEYAIWKSGAELRRRDERHFTTAHADPDGRARRPVLRPPPRGDRHAGLDPDRRTHRATHPLDGHVGLQRPEPRRGDPRRRRPPLARVRRRERRHRRAVPGRGQGPRRDPGRPPAAARLRPPRPRGGDRHDRRGHRRASPRRWSPGSAASASTSARPAARTSSPPPSRPTSWPSTPCSAEAQWSGAPRGRRRDRQAGAQEVAGHRSAPRASAAPRSTRRAPGIDTVDWFER